MPLTPREQEVLEKLLRGATSKQIARELGLSWRTIEVHRGHVLHELNVRNTIELLVRQSAGETVAGADQESEGARPRST